MAKINQLESLRVLKTVVEEKSFTQAAKQLGLTVARVSKSIERLEVELDTKLFIRSTRHMRLTDSGERSYQYAINLLEQWHGLRDELAETQAKPIGKIRVSVPVSWGLSVFSKLLAKFMSTYPEIDMDVNMSDQYVNVIEGKHDLVLRLADTLEDSSLLCKKLKTYKFIACASPEYLAQNGTPRVPTDLQKHACLVFSQSGEHRKWSFTKDHKTLDVYIEPYLHSNNSALFRESLLAHRGIALIPEFIVDADVLSGHLVPVLGDYSNRALNLYSLRPENAMLPVRLKLLNEFLHSELLT